MHRCRSHEERIRGSRASAIRRHCCCCCCVDAICGRGSRGALALSLRKCRTRWRGDTPDEIRFERSTRNRTDSLVVTQCGFVEGFFFSFFPRIQINFQRTRTPQENEKRHASLRLRVSLLDGRRRQQSPCRVVRFRITRPTVRPFVRGTSETSRVDSVDVFRTSGVRSIYSTGRSVWKPGVRRVTTTHGIACRPYRVAAGLVPFSRLPIFRGRQ